MGDSFALLPLAVAAVVGMLFVVKEFFGFNVIPNTHDPIVKMHASDALVVALLLAREKKLHTLAGVSAKSRPRSARSGGREEAPCADAGVGAESLLMRLVDELSIAAIDSKGFTTDGSNRSTTKSSSRKRRHRAQFAVHDKPRGRRGDWRERNGRHLPRLLEKQWTVFFDSPRHKHYHTGIIVQLGKLKVKKERP